MRNLESPDPGEATLLTTPPGVLPELSTSLSLKTLLVLYEDLLNGK